jgi:hypothetical protein
MLGFAQVCRGRYQKFRIELPSAIYHRGVKNACSVNMKLQAMTLGNFSNLVSVFGRETFPTTTAKTVMNIVTIILGQETT